MENKEIQFKTNLNCGGCVSKVQSDLDNAVGIGNWKVDIDNDDKILTVDAKGVSEEEVKAIVQSKGFQIEPIA
jgi:copper chaperone